ncbi:Bone marrow proteoglycan [Sciurus carolinensis]|uniref:Bone marrow proteoglycan n=1 Tax=Sciurus carolinensis TaxID=30640 RepID=A0AA41MYM4_SCICA|nr:Bone marrow proteoglycan [Sciurus carolinensis]
MKLPLLLTLLVGAVSTLHLRTETPDFSSPLEDEALLRNGEVLEPEAEEAPAGERMPLKEEEEGGSGSEDDPEEEEAVESDSALDVVDKDLQCPKEEDTVKLEGSPGCKTCGYLLVRRAKRFDKAQLVCRRCYRGNLASIHSFSVNYRIQFSVRGLNQGQVWIGGRIAGRGHCKSFRWVDGSSWNFAYWAAGQPWACGGRCVALCTRGGRWRRSHCRKRLPFICSY